MIDDDYKEDDNAGDHSSDSVDYDQEEPLGEEDDD
jgi:hypothetical protein